MLLIRNRQMAAIRAEIKMRYVPTVAAYLRKSLPAQVGNRSDPELLDFVAAGFKRAEAYGIDIEWDLARFLKFAVLFGPEFDVSQNWASSALNRDCPPTERMDRVENYYNSYLKQG